MVSAVLLKSSGIHFAYHPAKNNSRMYVAKDIDFDSDNEQTNIYEAPLERRLMSGDHVSDEEFNTFINQSVELITVLRGML